VANSADTTRARLVATAEHLFAEQGIDAVSLREVNRVAGTKNAVAVQYHFESRTGLIKAILHKHWPGIDARRHAMLDQYEADGSADLRVLASALVRPSAAKLADSDGGPSYLRISAQLLNRPQPPAGPAPNSDPLSSINRWRSVVEPLLPQDATRLHRRFTAMRFSAAELGRRASSGPHTDDPLFVSHLIDLVTGILVAPVSAETRRLADARDRSLAAAKSRP
jgi:AcrR family transcriptional regulator